MPPIRARSSSHGKSLLVAGVALVVALTACDRLPQIGPDASQLRAGDSLAVVADVLGEHSAEYRSRSEIEASEFGHFVFTSLTDASAAKSDASGLPEVVGRALWFPFLTTAGTLVYLDASDRVAAAFSAGT